MKDMQSTPRVRAHKKYNMLLPIERKFLFEAARDLGDLPETDAELVRRFYLRFSKEITRFQAHYWRRAAFSRPQSRSVKGGLSITLTKEQAAKVYRLVESNRFKSIAEVFDGALSLILE